MATDISPDILDDAMNPGLPTLYLVQLSDGGTASAQWVLGTDEPGIGFFAEFGRPAPGAAADADPAEDVADWVADSLGVTGVELAPTDDDRWSVTITD
jgi:hypothetical protein